MTYQIGMTFKGTKVLLPVNVPDDADEAERFEAAIAYYKSKGFGMPELPQGNLQQRLDNPQGYQAQAAPPQQQYAPPPQQGYAQWACPIHGGQSIKPGYQGRGFECGVTQQSTPPPWRYRDGAKQGQAPLGYTFWSNKDGVPVFACAEKSR